MAYVDRYTPEQRRAYMLAYRAERRQKALDLLGGECAVCGSTENLEFDHIDPDTKSGHVSTMLMSAKWDDTLVELQKCQLLCKAHHIEKSRLDAQGRSSRGMATASA